MAPPAVFLFVALYMDEDVTDDLAPALRAGVTMPRVRPKLVRGLSQMKISCAMQLHREGPSSRTILQTLFHWPA